MPFADVMRYLRALAQAGVIRLSGVLEDGV
jgi:hypothetical protein